MMTLYNAALAPLRAVAGAWRVWDGLRHDRREEWSERLGGRLPGQDPGGVWLHGSSVGEVRIVSRLATALREVEPACSIAVSCFTRTGRELLPTPPAVDAAFFAPLDFRGPVRRVLASVRPATLGLVETELWPNLITEALGRDIAVVVLNGRLSPERMRHYRRWSRLYAPLLREIDALGAQSQADAERFAELGVPASRISVTANIKYDLPPPTVDLAALRAELGIETRRPVFVAGSTAAGEDAAVLDAFELARKTTPELLLVLAPRHVERVESVERLARQRGHAVARLTSAAEASGEVDVLLVDGVGRLAALYALARVAFVGGSLVPTGGHNVLEPAAFGVPVAFGPHTDHVADPAAALEAAGGAVRVADGEELGRRIVGWLKDPAAAEAAGRSGREVLAANRGAVAASVALIRAQLRRARVSRGAA